MCISEFQIDINKVFYQHVIYGITSVWLPVTDVTTEYDNLKKSIFNICSLTTPLVEKNSRFLLVLQFESRVTGNEVTSTPSCVAINA